MSMYDQPYRSRRTSFSAGQSFAPYNDPFRPPRDGFNDPYNNGYSEVSGQAGPPPPASMPMPMPNQPPPPASSQQFPPPPGNYGNFPPPPGAMGTSYSMGNREQYNSPPEPMGYDQNPTGVPPPRAAYPDSYDNSPLSDSYFPQQLDDGFGARGRTFSTGGPGYGPPALLPSAPPMTPFPSSYGGKRMRRASSVGPGGFGLGGHMSMSDPYRRPGGVTVKFRPSGGHRDGITLNEATDSIRLSRSHIYAVRDIVDMRGRLTLKVRVRFSPHLSIESRCCILLICAFIDG
jgi:hypothetical protein